MDPQTQQSDLPKILIVDDEIDLAEILVEIFSGTFQCTVCTTAAAAFNLIKTHRYKFVLSDLHLPDADGSAVVEASVRAQPETPVIILSGSPLSEPSMQQAFQKGAAGIIAKPFHSPEQIIHYLTNFSTQKEATCLTLTT